METEKTKEEMRKYLDRLVELQRECFGKVGVSLDLWPHAINDDGDWVIAVVAHNDSKPMPYQTPEGKDVTYTFISPSLYSFYAPDTNEQAMRDIIEYLS